jgi:hypothetical protein
MGTCIQKKKGEDSQKIPNFFLEGTLDPQISPLTKEL